MIDDENAGIDFWSCDGDDFGARERDGSLRETDSAHHKSKKRNRHLSHEEGLSLAQELYREAFECSHRRDRENSDSKRKVGLVRLFRL